MNCTPIAADWTLTVCSRDIRMHDGRDQVDGKRGRPWTLANADTERLAVERPIRERERCSVGQVLRQIERGQPQRQRLVEQDGFDEGLDRVLVGRTVVVHQTFSHHQHVAAVCTEDQGLLEVEFFLRRVTRTREMPVGKSEERNTASCPRQLNQSFRLEHDTYLTEESFSNFATSSV